MDDTVIFVANERSAHEVKRRHHLALREMGLSPNASKTSIMTAEAYGASRHPEMNRRINDAREAKDAAAIDALVSEWYAMDRDETPSWDKVATRLYSAAKAVGAKALHPHAIRDIATVPTLTRAAFKYLATFDLEEADLKALLTQYGHFGTSVETRIEIARFLCDVPFATVPGGFTDSVIGNICEADARLGSGYARALFLLCLNKYGSKQDRDRVRRTLTIEDLQDDQLRLHYLYVYQCRGELDGDLARAVRHLDTPDISLLMRVCDDALMGKLTKHVKCLATCISTRAKRRIVEARHLPFLHALLRATPRAKENLAWLQTVATSAQLEKVHDGAVRRFLAEEMTFATR